jgi:flagellar biosynthesis/type III secretory pathway protein FliH
MVGVRSDVTIVVSPADAESARMFAHSLLELKEHWEHIRIVEEPEVSPGGCRVQWGSGSVDAALETQLDRIERDLKGSA